MPFRFATRAELLGLFHGANGPRAAAIDRRHRRVAARGGIGLVPLWFAPRGGVYLIPFSCPVEEEIEGDNVWRAEAEVAPSGNGVWHWCCVCVDRAGDDAAVLSENEQLLRELETGQTRYMAGFDRGRVAVELGPVQFRRRAFHQVNSVGFCEVYEAAP